MNVQVGPILLYEGNQAAIRIASNEERKWSKSIQINYYFVKKAAEREGEIQYLSRDENLADIFT